MITGAVKIGSHCRVGPFAHLRDGTVLDDGVEVGAFVEIKQSHLGQRARSCGTWPIWATPKSARASTSARRRSRPISTASGRPDQDRRPEPHRRRRDPGRAGERSATTPSSGPTPSSPATRTSPTARPSSACRHGRSNATHDPEMELLTEWERHLVSKRCQSHSGRLLRTRRFGSGP